ncbi:MAG: LysR substrate-binding domain-containing protein, partial [Pseudomonadota bacterium]
MKVQRKHLELVAAVNGAASLADVASQLNLTPSALSHQLREIESRIGAEVVQRKHKPINLTAVGQRLLAAADEVLPRLVALEDALARMSTGDTGRLHLAIECHSCYLWLMPTFEAYRGAWPDVELDIISGLSFEGMTALVAGDLDLVITADPEPLAGVTYVPLFEYESVLA